MSKAIFLGSFNPPHKGHRAIIESVINDDGLLNRLGIKQIHVIPCYQNPNKNKFAVSYIDRYKMTQYMFNNLINEGLVYVDDIEMDMRPEYTYELIDYFNSEKDLRENGITDDFWWIITTETLNEIIDEKWKNGQKLLSENKFIVVYKNDELIDKYKTINVKSIEFVKLKHDYDFHSTQLREKCKRFESIANETCLEVAELCRKRHFYDD